MADAVRSPGVSANGSACQIPYPDRFVLAHSFVSSIPEGAFNDETRLLLYALHKQATQGPCKEPKPWSFNVVESAMWKSWQSLGNMSHMEAMRLYVRTVDEEQPEWWTRLPPAQPAGPAAAAAAAGGAAAGSGGEGVSISSVFQQHTWVVIQQDDSKKPLPRYEQGAALLGANLVVLGGHYGGRYLSDVWTYNLNRLQWAAAAPAVQQPAAAAAAGEEGGGGEGGPLLVPGGPPAAAGWSVTPLGDDKLLVIGGHVKVGKLKKGEALPRISVWLLDVASMTWTALDTSGQIPCARGGHAACLLPDSSQVLVFGGEDSHRRPLADVVILDLQDLSWQELEIRSRLQPAPRSAAATTLYNGHLLVFGGGSIASCYNDVWLLDVARASWSRPEVRPGLPSPRAGHSGVLVGDAWYLLGGGNNVKGCTDMIAMDLAELFAGHVTWSKVCSVPPGSPLSSEGISLLHAPELNLLVAFGGYNGKYHNSVSVYKLPEQQEQQQQQGDQQQLQLQQQGSGSLEQEQQQQQHDQVQQRTHSMPALQQEPRENDPTANGIASPTLGHEQNLLKELALSREQLKRDLGAARQELELVAGAADAAREEAAAEVHLLRHQLNAAQAAAEEAHKAAEEARAALSAEQARTLRLEAQLAEAGEQLGRLGELERELGRYRQQEAEGQQGKSKGSSGSLWGYISGTQ